MDHSGEVERGNARVCEESSMVTIDVEGAGQRFVEACLHSTRADEPCYVLALNQTTSILLVVWQMRKPLGAQVLPQQIEKFSFPDL